MPPRRPEGASSSNVFECLEAFWHYHVLGPPAAQDGPRGLQDNPNREPKRTPTTPSPLRDGMCARLMGLALFLLSFARIGR
eukprot:3774880-Pyramimonas_sp.AAC.1